MMEMMKMMMSEAMVTHDYVNSLNYNNCLVIILMYLLYSSPHRNVLVSFSPLFRVRII